MNEKSWKWKDIFDGIHKSVLNELELSRKTGHSTTKGATSENAWLRLLQKHLPTRYESTSGFVVNRAGKFSEQIDIIVYDRQYSPIVFDYGKEKIVPEESVFAIFEVKQPLSYKTIADAKKKVSSVRKLRKKKLPNNLQTSNQYEVSENLIQDSQEVNSIIGGILTFDIEGKIDKLNELLNLDSVDDSIDEDEFLDIACIATYGYFIKYKVVKPRISKSQNAIAKFLFSFISLLQTRELPEIDFGIYINMIDEEGPFLGYKVIKEAGKHNSKEEARKWIEDNRAQRNWKNYIILEKSAGNFVVAKLL